MEERGRRLAEALERELPRTADHVALRRAAAEVLRPRVRFRWGIWATLDPLSAMWTSCVLDGFDRDAALERAVFHNEYRVPDVLKLRDLARAPRPAGALSLATGGDPASSARFREVFEPLGVSDELRVVFRVGGSPWGALVLLGDERPFTPEDVAAVQAIAAPFALRLRGALLATTAATVRDPAAILCAVDGRVLDVSPGAAAVLGVGRDAELPPAVAAVVARHVADGSGEALLPVAGGWTGLRCTWLGDRVLVLVDRIDPHRLADVLIEGAGLTDRERQVLESVLRGSTARAAAAALRMSEHTVNDHLKRVFTKFGVGSRGELVARLFLDGYEPLHAAGAAPSARGHFEPPPADSVIP